MQPDLRLNLRLFLAVFFSVLASAHAVPGAEDLAAPLPEGVKAVWDADKEYRESTATRERICLNGLWQWQPAEARPEQPPADKWGWFKVPGCWPGISDYLQKDCQTVFAHPAWKSKNLSS